MPFANPLGISDLVNQFLRILFCTFWYINRPMFDEFLSKKLTKKQKKFFLPFLFTKMRKMVFLTFLKKVILYKTFFWKKIFFYFFLIKPKKCIFFLKKHQLCPNSIKKNFSYPETTNGLEIRLKKKFFFKLIKIKIFICIIFWFKDSYF